MQKLIGISDYRIWGPFFEKYFSENWRKFLILLIKNDNCIKLTHVFNVLEHRHESSQPWPLYSRYTLLKKLIFLLSFLAQVVHDSENGNPCHEGLEATAPIGSFTCNPNNSICIEKWEGPNSGITSFDNIGLAMLTVFQVSFIFTMSSGSSGNSIGDLDEDQILKK